MNLTQNQGSIIVSLGLWLCQTQSQQIKATSLPLVVDISVVPMYTRVFTTTGAYSITLVGPTERRNLFQSITDALDITLEEDPSASKCLSLFPPTDCLDWGSSRYCWKPRKMFYISRFNINQFSVSQWWVFLSAPLWLKPHKNGIGVMNKIINSWSHVSWQCWSCKLPLSDRNYLEKCSSS